MTEPAYRRLKKSLLAAFALVLPSVVLAASPATVKPQADAIAPRQQAAPKKALPKEAPGELLKAVGATLNARGGHEASPFEPPGRPPDRPPTSPPGHNDPPNPPGQPPDRPPNGNGNGNGQGNGHNR